MKLRKKKKRGEELTDDDKNRLLKARKDSNEPYKGSSKKANGGIIQRLKQHYGV